MVRQVSFKNLISRTNLELAWRRITTGINHQHKKYFRGLYYAYETALDVNLRDLHTRLRGGSYRPQAPTRIYLPKPSGQWSWPYALSDLYYAPEVTAAVQALRAAEMAQEEISQLAA
jgi:hypothetical protein